MDRRDVVRLAIAELLTLPFCAHCATAQSNPSRGACLGLSTRSAQRSSLFELDGRPKILFPKSGDKTFDLALAFTLDKITTMFGVLPVFTFFDDGGDANAFAAGPRNPDERDGIVYVGSTLLRRYMREREHPEVAISTVVVHEYGHIVAFKHKLDLELVAGQRTAKRSELFADFLAGYYGGRKKLERSSYPSAVYADTLYRLGDDAFSDVDHHGTKAERASAVVRGFETAVKDRRGFADAVRAGFSYALQL